jgi:putative flippase GtrA
MSVSLESLMRPPAATVDSAAVGTQLVAFILVGGLGAVAFVALSTGLIMLGTGVPSWVISVACYACLIGPVYLAHRRFSFPTDAPHAQALPRYVSVQLCAMLLAAIFSYVLYGRFGLPTVAASLLVTGLTSGVNFVVLRLWAFAGGS